MFCTSRGRFGTSWWMVSLGAVLYGCALFVPAVGAAATINVQIIKPTDQPTFTFRLNQEYEFEAVAFIEGVELEGGQVTWDWDFGDTTPHSPNNPTTHTYLYSRNFTVTVTASYQGMTGQATINAAAAGGGVLEAIEVVTNPDTGGEVCDYTEVMARFPESFPRETGAIPLGAQFFIARVVQNEETGQNEESWESVATSSFIDRQFGEEWYLTASTAWDTCGEPNGKPVKWQVLYWLEVPPPPGEEAPYVLYLTQDASWTPHNTVLTGADECLILHCEGAETHTVEFDIDHLQAAAQGVDPKYHVILTIYDLAGNQVAQVTKDDVGVGGGSIDWEPEFAAPEGDPEPPPGQPVDENAIYTYALAVDHGMCGDSWPKPPLGSVSAAYITTVTSTNSFKAIVKYHLSQELSQGDITAWKKDTAGWVEAGGIGLSDLGPGDHWTEEFTVDGPSDGEYVYILTGTETAEAGEGNAGGEERPGRPGGDAPPVTPFLLKVLAVAFANEHNVLTDYAVQDWGDGGSKYVAPHWKADGSRNYPVSYTKNTTVQMTLIVQVGPTNSNLEISGNGGSDYLSFSANEAGVDGGVMSFTLTAQAPLPDKVDVLEKSIQWTLNLEEPAFQAQCTSGPHNIYVTIGTPELYAPNTTCTEQRLRWACNAARGHSELLPVAEAIFNALDTANSPVFAYGADNNTKWLLMRDGQQAQCRDLAWLMKAAMGIIGAASSVGYVYATTDNNNYSSSTNATETRLCIPAHRDPPFDSDERLCMALPGFNMWEAVCRVMGTQQRLYAPKQRIQPKATSLEILQQLIGEVPSDQCYQGWFYRNPEENRWLLCDQPGAKPVLAPFQHQ